MKNYSLPFYISRPIVVVTAMKHMMEIKKCARRLRLYMSSKCESVDIGTFSKRLTPPGGYAQRELGCLVLFALQCHTFYNFRIKGETFLIFLQSQDIYASAQKGVYI